MATVVGVIAGSLVFSAATATPAAAADPPTTPLISGPPLISNASFSQGTAPWQVSPGANYAVYHGIGAQDGSWLTTNTGSYGADSSVYQDVSTNPELGRSYTGSIEMRSEGTPVSVLLALWAIGPNGAVPSFTQVTVSSTNWTQYAVDIDIGDPNYTDLRLQVYLLTTGVNLDLDGASVTGVFNPLPPPPTARAIVQLAESQDQYNAGIQETPRDSNCNPYTGFFGRGSTAGCAPGLAAEEWCSDFAQWVWLNAGINTNGIGAWSFTFVDWAVAHGAAWQPGATNDPEPGDAVIWGTLGGGGYGAHVGIVVAVNGGDIDVVS